MFKKTKIHLLSEKKRMSNSSCSGISGWVSWTLFPSDTSWHFLSSCAPRLVYTSSRWQWIVSSTLTCRSDKDNIPAPAKTLENTHLQIHPLRQWQRWEATALHNINQRVFSSWCVIVTWQTELLLYDEVIPDILSRGIKANTLVSDHLHSLLQPQKVTRWLRILQVPRLREQQ